jgi:hypothetical protein
MLWVLSLLWTEADRIKKEGQGMDPADVIQLAQRAIVLTGNAHYIFNYDRHKAVLAKTMPDINGHNIVGYFIKHCDSDSHTSLFESLPIQVTYHVGYTACVMVSTRYKACCSSLYSFQFIFVLFGMW